MLTSAPTYNHGPLGRRSSERITFRVPNDDAAELRRVAAERGVSVSALLRHGYLHVLQEAAAA